MSEFVTIKGRVKWFKHMKPDVFKTPDGRVSETWQHTIWPDEPSLNKIRDLQAEGMKNLLRKDEDGYYIKFSRPRTTSSGFDLEPPYVVGPDGKTQYGSGVGDGSEVTTRLEVYEHKVPGSNKKSKAARWASSRIDILIPKDEIPYDKDRFQSVHEARAGQGLDKLPKPERVKAGWE